MIQIYIYIPYIERYKTKFQIFGNKIHLLKYINIAIQSYRRRAKIEQNFDSHFSLDVNAVYKDERESERESRWGKFQD